MNSSILRLRYKNIKNKHMLVKNVSVSSMLSPYNTNSADQLIPSASYGHMKALDETARPLLGLTEIPGVVGPQVAGPSNASR